jgi:hypothetical protein
VTFALTGRRDESLVLIPSWCRRPWSIGRCHIVVASGAPQQGGISYCGTRKSGVAACLLEPCFTSGDRKGVVCGDKGRFIKNHPETHLQPRKMAFPSEPFSRMIGAILFVETSCRNWPIRRTVDHATTPYPVAWSMRPGLSGSCLWQYLASYVTRSCVGYQDFGTDACS